MELLAVIVALESIKAENANITVYTDSKYVVDAIEKKWLFTWENKNFAGKKNRDLWEKFRKIYPKHSIRFIWVKGHASNTENIRCDELAVKASFQVDLKEDSDYIASLKR